MILQLENKDDAKKVLGLEYLESKSNDMQQVIELLRSEMIFERAIKSLGMDVSLYSRGKILTEEKYLSSSFNVQPYHLYDSTLVGKEIGVKFNGKEVSLSYIHKGKNKSLKGILNEHLRNEDFDIVVKAGNELAFTRDSKENELYFVFNSIKLVKDRLIGGLTVQPINAEAKTINIAFRSNNARLCHDMTWAVAQSYIEFSEELKSKGSNKVLKFIETQLDSLASVLQDSKDSLVDFQRRTDMTSPDEIGGDLYKNVNEIQDKLITIQNEIEDLIELNRKLTKSPTRLEVYRLMADIYGSSYESILIPQLKELHKLMEEKEDLLIIVTSDHIRVQRINEQIKSSIELVNSSIGSLQNKLNLNASNLRNKLNEIRLEKLSLPEQKMEYSRLKNIQDLNEKYFFLLTEKKVQYGISEAGYDSFNNILKKPKIDPFPVAPSKKIIYGSFFALGLILGLGIMFLKYIMFNEVNTEDDLASVLPLEATILGTIPLFDTPLEYSQMIIQDVPKSILAESMRRIRTNLYYKKPDFQTIAISSSISGEGKTFVALNLGGIIAMSGKKTILVDLDLRKPKVHLGMDTENVVGMSSLIVGQAKIDDCIHKSKAENFDFITAGPIPPNPSELLLSKNFQNIIEELKTRYDVIILDNPPVGLVSDGVKNLTEADIPIYVFKSQYSKRSFALRVKELFEVQQLKGISVVLNGVKPSRRNTYGYSYGYGYGYGYTEDENQVKGNRWLNAIKKWFGR